MNKWHNKFGARIINPYPMNKYETKTIESKIIDILGFFMSLDKEDQKLVFKLLKDFMDKGLNKR
jgi:hypothetical protein